MNAPFFDNLGLKEVSESESEGMPSWLSHLRSEAADRLLEEGLPTRKTEAWRFTSLAGLLKLPFTPAARNTHNQDCQQWAEEQLGPDNTSRIYLVNGMPIGFHDAPDDVEISQLAQLLIDEPEAIQPYLARHAQSQFFGALNSAMFQDGVAVHVKRGTKPAKTLQIVHISDPGEVQTCCYPRLTIVVEDNAEFSLIETYLTRPGAEDLCNAVTEVILKPGAKVDHLRIVEGADKSYHIAAVAIHQAKDSSYVSRSVVMGGKLCRVDFDAQLTETGAECRLDGVYHAVGSEHVDHNTCITHDASHCSSVEEYRGLIDDRAHAVFDGTIIVKRDAQQSSAHQQNHNLLLSDSATINTKPHLEIDADDITASHGATIGALDPDQLFFLRARGIDEDQARAMLTFSFVRSILDRIESEPVRDRLVQKLIQRLPNGESIMELAQ